MQNSDTRSHASGPDSGLWLGLGDKSTLSTHINMDKAILPNQASLQPMGQLFDICDRYWQPVMSLVCVA